MKTAEIRKYLSDKKLDAIVLFNKTPNFDYFVEEDLDHGIMFITKKENVLFVSPLNSPKIKGFKVVHWKKFKEDFKKFVKQRKIRVAGTDYNTLTLPKKKFISKFFKTKDASDFLIDLRVCKSKDEISKIRNACRITDRIFQDILADFKFKREEEVSTFIKIRALELGAEMAFEPIVASGSNATIPHHDSKSKLKKGFLVLDFGARFEGYCSDMTRTIYLGKPTKKEEELYEKILKIQESCIEKTKIGLNSGKLFDHSVNLFGKDAKYFTHGLGHGFGVEIHEKPSLSLKSKDALEKECVLTIEPGYYNRASGIGIRIEDDIYLGAKKEVLTKSPKELIIIDFKD
jgi:Xaa-Pro aminopeptidase